MKMIADTVFKNAKIYTVNDNQKWADSIAIKDSKIIFVGEGEDVESYIGSHTRVMDLQQKMVLPGFIDSHAHPLMGEVNLLFDVYMYYCESVEECLNTIRDYKEQNPDAAFITGYGWSNTLFSNQGPSAAELDKIVPDVPAALHSADYHSIWVNSRALEIAGVDKNTPDPEGGVIERLENGEPSGTFRENAQEIIKKIIPEPSIEKYKTALKSYQNKAVRVGITSSYEAWIKPDGKMFEAYRAADASGELFINMFGAVAPSPVAPEKGIEFIKMGNRKNDGKKFKVKHIKLFIDGVVEGNTALLKQPYDNKSDYNGEPIWKNELIKTVTETADENGWDMHFHVIGDAAVAKMLELMDNLKQKYGKKDRRSIAAHIQLVDPQDIPRLIENNIVFSSNPFWHYKEEGYFNDIEVKYLGNTRACSEYPMNSLISSGVITAAGSDYPISSDPSPLLGIQIGMTRSDPDAVNNTDDDVLNIDERVSLEEMIRCFTINGAYANRVETSLGTIEAGKTADLVVLDKNIFDVPADKLASISVEATMADGSFVYTADDFII